LDHMAHTLSLSRTLHGTHSCRRRRNYERKKGKHYQYKPNWNDTGGPWRSHWGQVWTVRIYGDQYQISLFVSIAYNPKKQAAQTL
jgi:hypothetical protein